MYGYDNVSAGNNSANADRYSQNGQPNIPGTPTSNAGGNNAGGNNGGNNAGGNTGEATRSISETTTSKAAGGVSKM
jgi:hypothetical protein